MKITEIRAMRLTVPPRAAMTPPRRQAWAQHAEVANPMSRYPKVKAHRSLWLPTWEGVWCKVTVEDGTWGLGYTSHGRPVAAVIDDHLAPQLVGEDCLAIEKLADMLFRLTKPYGSTGLASYAVSAVDLALWDLRGKLLAKPVYELLGGPQKDRIFCYCTGNDVDWYQELGFRAFKLACPYGPTDGLDGIHKNEEFVARAHEQIGDGCELMLDCWMAFDVEYSVRLAETLRPYKLKWMEECLIPEDLDGHVALRERLPWQTPASGEHWYTHVPLQWALTHKVVDILQPDITWCGGVTTCQKVAAAADAAGVSVILHGGGNTLSPCSRCIRPVPLRQHNVRRLGGPHAQTHPADLPVCRGTQAALQRGASPCHAAASPCALSARQWAGPLPAGGRHPSGCGPQYGGPLARDV